MRMQNKSSQTLVYNGPSGLPVFVAPGEWVNSDVSIQATLALWISVGILAPEVPLDAAPSAESPVESPAESPIFAAAKRQRR
jgi:hypothetical protein